VIVHVLRKPVVGTVAQNALTHGCGALNIDGCRIVTSDNLNGGTYSGKMRKPLPGDERTGKSAGRFGVDGALSPEDYTQPTGRWPANLVHDGDERVVGVFPDCKGNNWVRTDGARVFNNNGNPTNCAMSKSDDSFGSASRFFQQVEVK